MLQKLLTTSLATTLLIIGAFVALVAFVPTEQDPGQQTTLYSGATVNATPQAQTVACGQGSGSIGRKTLAVWNSPASLGKVTVTVELRDTSTAADFTSGYLAVAGVVTNATGTDTALPSEAGGAVCHVTATATTTVVFSASLRRE